MSTLTLSLAIGSSSSINNAYLYGIPGERGSRTVRAVYEDRPLTARVGIGRGRGAVVSYTLYVTFPSDVIGEIPNGRVLSDSDGKDRTRDGKRVGSADYLFSLTGEEYAALTTTLNPETAYIAKADIPSGEKVIAVPGIAIPTRFGKVAESGETPIPSEAKTAPESEPKPSRRVRVPAEKA